MKRVAHGGAEIPGAAGVEVDRRTGNEAPHVDRGVSGEQRRDDVEPGEIRMRLHPLRHRVHPGAAARPLANEDGRTLDEERRHADDGIAAGDEDLVADGDVADRGLHVELHERSGSRAGDAHRPRASVDRKHQLGSRDVLVVRIDLHGGGRKAHHTAALLRRGDRILGEARHAAVHPGLLGGTWPS